jgi:hypothetical protein
MQAITSGCNIEYHHKTYICQGVDFTQYEMLQSIASLAACALEGLNFLNICDGSCARVMSELGGFQFSVHARGLNEVVLINVC